MAQMERGKGHVMTLISGEYVAKLAAGTANDAWVQRFGYGPKLSSETYSAFGYEDAVVVEDTYEGVKGSFDILPNASNIVEAVLTRQDLASFVGFDVADAQEFYLVSNVRDKQGNYFRSHYLRKLKLVDAPYDASVDGQATMKFDFEGTGATKFKYPIMVEQFTGSGMDGQVLTLANQAVAYKGDYALLVLDGATELSKAAGEFSETQNDITITIGTTNKITVLYLYSP